MALLEQLVAQPPPLTRNEDGAVLVTGTRVPLDTVVYAFQEGRTPEQIVKSYPTLRLEDVYAVITYYLWYREDVDAYLEQREASGEEVQRSNTARWPGLSIREKLAQSREPGTNAG